MAETAIDNAVINPPYVEPVRHFAATVDGHVTGEIEGRRRPSEFFVRVARPKTHAAQMSLDIMFGSIERHSKNVRLDRALATAPQPASHDCTRAWLARWHSSEPLRETAVEGAGASRPRDGERDDGDR